MTPGSHGSTYAGNPLAAAVGNAVLDLLLEANLLDELVDELFAPGGFWAEQE